MISFMSENNLHDLAGLHDAMSWVVQSSNSHAFVNGFTATRLALGRKPHLPGLLSVSALARCNSR